MSEEAIVQFSDLTEDERRYLAMHARYKANHQVDMRYYIWGMNDDGTVKLRDTWPSRHERERRWNAIADALHPAPWGPA